MSVTARSPTIRVLLTEDVAADAELEVRELKRAGLRLTHRIVDTEESFTAALREFAPDVILSDFSMPGFDGMAALAIARELAPDTPFIFVSGTIGEEYAIRALKSGATDYVLKSNLVRLPAAVERAIAEARQRRERRRTEAELDIARERLDQHLRLAARRALVDRRCPSAASSTSARRRARSSAASPTSSSAIRSCGSRWSTRRTARALVEAWRGLLADGRRVRRRVPHPCARTARCAGSTTARTWCRGAGGERAHRRRGARHHRAGRAARGASSA